MTYQMHVAEPNRNAGIYSTVDALRGLISELNDYQRTAKYNGHYETIVSAFPLGNVAVVITETKYT